jgi:hypothetical protein
MRDSDLQPDATPARRRRRHRLPPGLVRARDAAAWSSVGLRTWRTWDAAGIVPRPIRVGACVLWSLHKLRAWRDAGCPDRRTWDAIRGQATCPATCRDARRR